MNQLADALRAGTERAFQHRKMLRKASVWLRFWPSDMPPVQNKTEHCELELVQHFHNDARGEILVSIDGSESRAVWLHDADIQCVETGRRAPATTTQGKSIQGGLPVVAVNLPEWLAREKGLI